MDRKFDQLLLKEHLPSSVIGHYTKKETFLEHIIPTGKLRFSRLSATNDPRECKEWSFPSVSVGGADNTNVGHFHQQANARLNSFLRDRSFVCCGTRNMETERFDCCLRPRMWAQYGDNHLGVCLLLNRERMDAAVNRMLSANEELISDAVVYSNDCPIQVPVPFEVANLDETVDCIVNCPNNRRYFLFQKHTDWQAENEHRWIIVAPNRGGSPFEIALDEVLVGVVVGAEWPRLYNGILKNRFPCRSKVILGREEWLYMDSPSVSHLLD